ncbi:MAG: NADH-quinone oxidoreductase subunit C [Dehalococcoidia bacterium]|nr:NADH-quinone oxidoreductase subunit C [Dehalococcoidia bacterium]
MPEEQQPNLPPPPEQPQPPAAEPPTSPAPPVAAETAASAPAAPVVASAPAAPPPPAVKAPVIPPGQRDAAKASAVALQAGLATAWEGIGYTEAINFGDLEVTLAPADVFEACRRAQTHPALACDYLMLLTGTDFETYFEVIYHLYSYGHRHRLTIKARIDDYEHPAVASVTPLWPAAAWHERETREMLGIDFPGNADLRPLLLDDDVDEYPLRKSHKLVEPYADRPGVVMGPGA